MTDAYGAAAVTAVLKGILSETLNSGEWLDELSDPSVTARPPDLVLQNKNQAGLNLFLYRVNSNQGWPNRGQSHPEEQRASSTPILALDLHYMLSAIGTEDFQTDVLLGHASQTMEEHAIVPGSMVREQLKNLSRDKKFDALLESGLADQIEQVKITPRFLDDETLSKIWSSIQSEFRPSLFYEVSTVLVSRDTPDQPALPVQEVPNVNVTPSDNPHITKVEPVTEIGSSPPSFESAEKLFPGGYIRITGSSLASDHVRIRVDGGERTTDPPETKSNEQLIFSLPGGLSAGTHSLQVVHLFDPDGDGNGTGTVPESDLRLLFETNAAPFMIHPNVTRIEGTKDVVEIEVEPDLRQGQRGYLLIRPDSRSGTGDAESPEMISLQEIKTRTGWGQGNPESITDASAYDVTLQLDGAYSESVGYTRTTEERIVDELTVEEQDASTATVEIVVQDENESAVANAEPVLVWIDSQGTRLDGPKTVSTGSSGTASTTFPTPENGIYRVRVLTVNDGSAVYNPFESVQEAQYVAS